MGNGWEMVPGEALTSWIDLQLAALSDSLRLELVDGDQSVKVLMEDMEGDLAELKTTWEQRLSVHGEELGRAWFLDQNVVATLYPQQVPDAEMLPEGDLDGE